MLLIELEEARGNHMVHEEEVSSTDVSSTSVVISQHLVTFRSVEELQKQNQRLLVALRELSDAQEKEEFETTGHKYATMFMLFVWNAAHRLFCVISGYPNSVIAQKIRMKGCYRTRGPSMKTSQNAT